MLALYFRHTILSVIWTLLKMSAFLSCSKAYPKRKGRKELLSFLKAVGLSKHLRHKPTQMSGGQQQRVGIARAFVTNPEIVFADEPTGNLDSKTSMEVLELMAGLTMKNRQTLIMVTHDLNIAKRADRIIYILDGRIEGIEENQYAGVTYEQN